MRKFVQPCFLLAVSVLSATAAEPSNSRAELTAREFSDARKIYVAKCAKCHELYEPKAYKETEWAEWMAKMGKKSKLKPDQAQLLVRYTDLLRSTPGVSGKAATK